MIQASGQYYLAGGHSVRCKSKQGNFLVNAAPEFNLFFGNAAQRNTHSLSQLLYNLHMLGYPQYFDIRVTKCKRLLMLRIIQIQICIDGGKKPVFYQFEFSPRPKTLSFCPLTDEHYGSFIVTDMSVEHYPPTLPDIPNRQGMAPARFRPSLVQQDKTPFTARQLINAFQPLYKRIIDLAKEKYAGEENLLPLLQCLPENLSEAFVFSEPEIPA